MTATHMPELPLIDRIKIIAEFLVPILDAMEQDIGTERAHDLIRRGAAHRFREIARQAYADTNGDIGATMSATQVGVRPGIDIEVDVKGISAQRIDMDITSCVYARFFEELGRPELGFLLVCSADFDFVEEIPGVELARTQTMMEGADHCDFRYRFLNQ